MLCKVPLRHRVGPVGEGIYQLAKRRLPQKHSILPEIKDKLDRQGAAGSGPASVDSRLVHFDGDFHVRLLDLHLVLLEYSRNRFLMVRDWISIPKPS